MWIKQASIGMMDTQKAAVTYSRVSTDGQVDGFSLDVQRRETMKAAEKLGCKVLREFVDEGVSGTLEERPAFAELLLFCAKNKGKVTYVIVKDLVYQSFPRKTVNILHDHIRAFPFVLCA